jgi:hypothetical protein
MPDFSFFPQSFDEETGLAIGDRAKIILAGMLPGCTARRYDLPDAPFDYWAVLPCFVDHGPIVPMLSLNYHRDYRSVGLSLHYMSMLHDQRDLGIAFPSHNIPALVRLDSGPEAMAENLYQAICEVELAAMLAEGTIERIVSERPRYEGHPWLSYYLGQCAAYLGQYEETHVLVKNALKYAEECTRIDYSPLVPRIRSMAAKLNADPDSLRQELVATMEDNWAHLKIVTE